MKQPHPHEQVLPYANSRKSKKDQVVEMFDQIAKRYDFLNHFLSARSDIKWRKRAIRYLKPDRPRVILDVATGTADMAILASRILRPDRIVGIDLSARMLEIGRKKVEKERLQSIVQLQEGDSETIKADENTFDGVMVAFGVRNFENLEKGLLEMLRVLKPGGRLVVLEFSRPRRRLVRNLYNLYMGIVAPGVARWFRQNKEAYQYLCESANRFPDRQIFTDILNKVGFTATGYEPLSLGICCIYHGRKPHPSGGAGA
ncbi:MAG TPA: bifunctional demethylmenaquinone methyltransferase/2-methoxy-6-polyprenyl-1,4-benzoquinol methylase UbiE [Chitinophagaceae bacterium]|nr:bifunctional demethylmenaquinone methyltransferase/2-methoxy-6-polyprenyl-1,4-benzoquinol methylase UbiE [Chitinophagaceae bacterium]